jgi:hypothetical protein
MPTIAIGSLLCSSVEPGAVGELAGVIGELAPSAVSA